MTTPDPDNNGSASPAPKKKKQRARQPTEKELEQRILMVQGMLAKGAPKHVVKQACYQEWGVGWRTAERYMARARDASIEQCEIPRVEIKAIVQCYLQEKMYRCERDADKLQAAKQLINLLGLNAPVKFAETDTEGNTLTPAQRTAHYKAILAERFGGSQVEGNGDASTDDG